MNEITITINERNIVFKENTFVKQWVLQLTAAARYFGKGLTEASQFLSRTGSQVTAKRLLDAANAFTEYEVNEIADDDVNDIITFDEGDTWCERKANALSKAITIIEEAVDFAKSVRNTDLASDLTMIQLQLAGEYKTFAREKLDDSVIA